MRSHTANETLRVNALLSRAGLEQTCIRFVKKKRKCIRVFVPDDTLIQKFRIALLPMIVDDVNSSVRIRRNKEGQYWICIEEPFLTDNFGLGYLVPSCRLRTYSPFAQTYTDQYGREIFDMFFCKSRFDALECAIQIANSHKTIRAFSLVSLEDTYFEKSGPLALMVQ